MLRFNIKCLKDLTCDERKKVFGRILSRFPEEKRMKLTHNQVKSLMHDYNARLFSIGDIGAPEFLCQISVSGLVGDLRNKAKLVLGDLSSYKSFNGGSIIETIRGLSESQFEHYSQLYIEVGDNDGNFPGILRSSGFQEITTPEEIVRILGGFVKGKNNTRLDFQNNGSYLRRGGYRGEIVLRKRLLTLSK